MARTSWRRRAAGVRLARCGWALAMLALACGPKTKASALQPVTSEVVSDPSGEFRLDIGYELEPERHVELVLSMNAIGTREMDKIVIDVGVDGFDISEGSVEWAGFVPPRQPQKHRVTLRALDGAEDPSATIRVRRSMDSELLFQQTLTFSVTGSGLVLQPET